MMGKNRSGLGDFLRAQPTHLVPVEVPLLLSHDASHGLDSGGVLLALQTVEQTGLAEKGGNREKMQVVKSFFFGK